MQSASIRAALILMAFGVALFVTASPAHAQSIKQLRQLSAEEFVAEAAPAWKANKKKPVSRAQITKESVRRLTETDQPDQAKFASLDQIVAWAGKSLSDEQKQTLRKRIEARQGNLADLSPEDLKGLHPLLYRLGQSQEELDQLLASWIDAHDLSKLDFATLEFLSVELASSPVIGNLLRIEWNGSLQPQKQGRYTFSISRHYNELEYREGRVRTQMRVWLRDVKILDTVENGWHTPSKSVLLDADRSVPIRVEFAYEKTEKVYLPGFPGVAILYWEGPQIEREVVPASALSQPDNKGPGLAADYRCLNRDRATGREDLLGQFERVDPQIDFCWWDPGRIGFRPRHPKLPEIVEQLAQRYASTEYLDQRIPLAPQRAYREVNDWRRASTLMNSSQRKRILRAMIDHPAFTKSVPTHFIQRTCETFFAGAEDEAMELEGKMLLNQPEMQVRFGRHVQESSSSLNLFAEFMSRLPPEGLTFFRDRCLVDSEGNCCLAAGYALSQGHEMKRSIDEWIEWLDEQLLSAEATGNRRVNWLIVRAYAESLRHNEPRVARRFSEEKPLAGWDLLEDAMESAESDDAALRVAHIQIGRLLRAKQSSQINELLGKLPNRLKSPASAETLATWRKQLADLGAKTSPVELVKVDRQQYLTLLEARAASARERKDTEAETRYTSLIKQLKAGD